MRDALLLVDVVNSFDDDDGDVLLASFRARLPGFRELLARSRVLRVRRLSGRSRDIACDVVPGRGETMFPPHEPPSSSRHAAHPARRDIACDVAIGTA